MQSTFQSGIPGYSVEESSELPPRKTRAASENSGSARERRHRSQPIPYNLSEYLNEDQSLSLRQMEGFGWQLAFVRRPLFQEPTVVVANADRSRFGVLEVDGSINTEALLTVRH